VLVTLKVKLLPTLEQAEVLLATMRRVNEACDWISAVAFEKRVFGQVGLHREVYATVREKFGLSSQMAVRAIGKCVESYKLDRRAVRHFRPLGAIAYDQRNLAWKGVEAISLATLGGRLTIPIVLGGYQAARLIRVRGQADLVYASGKFYLAVVVDVPEEAPLEPEGFLGVDLGIVNIATDSDGTSYSGAALNARRAHRTNLRAKVQAKGTKSGKRLLKKWSGREARHARTENHRIAKELVARAKGSNRGIAVEQLDGIRNRVRTVGRRQRRAMNSWAFYQLKSFVLYKARIAGVPVVEVDPKNTSRTCSRCGHCEKANRVSQNRFLCRSCGFVAHADHNAAKNIGRAAVSLPNAGEETAGSLHDRPLVSSRP
jgi:putative transposase